MKKKSSNSDKLNTEDFLLCYGKLCRNGKIDALFQLECIHPEIAASALSDALSSNQAHYTDMEVYYTHPICMDSPRMSERRIFDMIAYLLCKPVAPDSYLSLLRAKVPARKIFNFETMRYQNDYVRDALWNEFFLGCQELAVPIKARHIHNLIELEYYSSEYFEQYH